MKNIRKRWEMHIQFQSEKLKGQAYLGNPGIERMILKWDQSKQDMWAWTELIWHKIVSSGRPLRMW
jgi:hypothetical protein